MQITRIPNIHAFQGSIPPNQDLVVYSESNPKECYVLYGFDEIDSDFGIKDPKHGFLKNDGKEEITFI